MIDLNVKYFDKRIPKLDKIEKGDWIDLRVSRIECMNKKNNYDEIQFNTNVINEYHYDKFQFMLFYLGIGMELPEGYEALVAPRGSTFNKTGLIQTNSPGVIDNTYRGNEDEWLVPVFSLIPGRILKYQRLFQFRIIKNMEKLNFRIVENLSDISRGRHGSTG